MTDAFIVSSSTLASFMDIFTYKLIVLFNYV